MTAEVHFLLTYEIIAASPGIVNTLVQSEFAVMRKENIKF